MGRMAKILGGIVIGLVALVVAGIAILKSLDFNDYKGVIAEQAKAATGRELVLTGNLELDISLNPALTLEGLSFANAAWGSRPEMVRLKRLEAEVELMPLLTGDVRVKRLVLIGLDVLAETDAKGRGNWVFATAPTAKAAEPATDDAGGATLPVVELVRIEDVTLAYADGVTGERMTFGIKSLEASAKGLDAPLTIDLAGAYNGAAFKAKGSLGSLQRLLEGGAPFPISLTAEALGATLGVEGAIAEPAQAKGIDLAIKVEGGELQATVRDVQAVVPALGELALPAIGPYSVAARIKGSPDNMSVGGIVVSVDRAEQVLLTVKGALADAVGLKGLDVTLAVEARDISPFAPLAGGSLPKVPPFNIQAGLKDQAGGYLVEGLKIKVGESDLAGRLALILDGKPPRIDAAITSSLLDIDALLPAGDEKASAMKKEAPDGEKRLFPADPLPLEGLKAAEAKVTVRAKRVIAGGAPIEDLSVDISLAKGRLAVKPLSAGLSGGTIGVSLDLDGSSGRQAALDARVNIKGIDTGALLKTMKLTELLQGGGLDGTIGLKARGASVRDLMASLTGEIVVTLGKGRVHNSAMDLAGADLASKAFTALNPLAEKEEYTELSCGALRFVVKDGMATAKKGIAIQTPKMNIVGDGTVNLKTEEIDFAVQPEARQGLGINLASVAGMVRATGTRAEPTVGLDKLGAATGALSVGTAIATGGLSLLATGLIGRATADENACQTALGKTMAAKLVAAKPAETQPTTTETAAPPPSPAEKKESGFGGFLKGLGKSLDQTLGTKK